MYTTEEWKEIQLLSHTHRAALGALITHIQNDSFLQQALFFGSHHKVVRVILVVDNVFQVNTYKAREKDVLSHTKQRFSFLSYCTS